MTSKFEMTKDFLDTNLKNLKNAHKAAGDVVAKRYDEILDAQKELVATCILERVNEHFTYIEDVKKMKEPFVQRAALQALSEMKVDKLLIFPEKSMLFPETIDFTRSYGFKIDKASREDCIHAKISPWDRVYHLTGSIKVGDVFWWDIEREEENHA